MKFAFPLFRSRKQSKKTKQDEKILAEASDLAHLRLQQYMADPQKHNPLLETPGVEVAGLK